MLLYSMRYSSVRSRRCAAGSGKGGPLHAGMSAERQRYNQLYTSSDI